MSNKRCHLGVICLKCSYGNYSGPYKRHYFLFDLNGAIRIFPITSNTGNTLRINLIAKTIKAYFQFRYTMIANIIHSIQYNTATQCGKFGSSAGSVPFFLAWIKRISSVVTEETTTYVIVNPISIGEADEINEVKLISYILFSWTFLNLTSIFYKDPIDNHKWLGIRPSINI